MDYKLLRQKLRHIKLSGAMAHYAGRALLRFLDLEVSYLTCLEPSYARSPRSEAELECRPVEGKRLRREALDPLSGFARAEVKGALARGETCMGVFAGDTLASHAWYTSGLAHLRGDVWVRFNPLWTYCRWAFTRPEYRGLHLNAVLKRHVLGYQARAGRRGILSLVNICNSESLRAAERAGCRRVGTVATVRSTGRWHTWASTACSPYELSMVVAPDPPRRRQQGNSSAAVPGLSGRDNKHRAESTPDRQLDKDWQVASEVGGGPAATG